MFVIACITVLLLSPATRGDSNAGRPFAVAAESVVLEIEPRRAGRNFLELPPLQYRFRLEAGCADGGQPESFALNVADTRLTLDQAQLGDPALGAAHEFTLTVPADQLAPVALTSFCLAPDTDSTAAASDGARRQSAADGELLIQDALAAHASLLCKSGASQRITYLSTPLDIRLVCKGPPARPAVTGKTN